MTIADALPLRPADAVATPVPGAAAPAAEGADFALALAGMMTAVAAPEGAEPVVAETPAGPPETAAPQRMLSDLAQLAVSLPATASDATPPLPLAPQPAPRPIPQAAEVAPEPAFVQPHPIATPDPLPLASQPDPASDAPALPAMAQDAAHPQDSLPAPDEAATDLQPADSPAPPALADLAANPAPAVPAPTIRPDAKAQPEATTEEPETTRDTAQQDAAAATVAAPVAALPQPAQTAAPAPPAAPTAEAGLSPLSARNASTAAPAAKATAPANPAPETAPAADAAGSPENAQEAAAPETRSDPSPLRPRAKPATAGTPTGAPTDAPPAQADPDTEIRPLPAAPDRAPVRLTADTAPQIQTASPSQPAPTTAPVALDRPGWEAPVTDRILAELSQDGSRIDLDLTPEHLGKLRITLEMVDGQAQVRFLTETPEAARLIQQSEHRLSESLSRAGLSLGTQDSNSRDAQTASQSQQNPQQGDRNGRPSPRQTEALFQRPAPPRDGTPPLRPASGRLNLIA